MDKINLLQNKWVILIIIAIIIVAVLITLLVIQNHTYKRNIGWYDTLLLATLENDLECLIDLAEKKQLTQVIYSEKRNNLRNICTFIGASPNIGFMDDKLYNLLDDNQLPIERLDDLKKMQLKLENLLRELHSSINLYNHFRNDKNKEMFIKDISGLSYALG
ncbi:low affinity Fe/Cu permease [Sedimentibacter acidaminivorans]|jgi:hypothetical protein|uniref:Low affinity Fe/Cu permease n=1 Tax=Sedimentibacter acidaminivorans TaxID=913099 RepID=A0ABS4GGC3_9FIRM|nr:hypothetical protein [Sedimentibacter acidaminivorans]MBP1926741.1 low affinity Fe/Cu permease [Sedimentibacter acidaminivorans]